MSGLRTALLIVTDTYADDTFSRLRAPRHDARELAEVLGDPKIGAYQVDMLVNQRTQAIRVRLNEAFGRAGRDDLILLYVSGHGIKDEAGRLHFAGTDTRRDLLAATAVPAQFVRDLIDESRARRVIVWLDCCYAGAFPAGMVPKAEGWVDVLPQLSAGAGRGCAVMTASTHIQYAFERGNNTALGGSDLPSVFTSAIITGLRTGDADRNEDGLIDTDELYDYVLEEVKAVTPDQTPTRNDQVTGQLYVARSGRGTRPRSDLPVDEQGTSRRRKLEHAPPVHPVSPEPVVTSPGFVPMPSPPDIGRWRPFYGFSDVRPKSVTNAFRLLMTIVATSILSLVLDLTVASDAMTEAARESLTETNKTFTEQDLANAVNLRRIVAVMTTLFSVWLFTLLAYKLRAGKNWARVVLAVLCGLHIVGTLLTVFGISQTTTLNQLFSVVVTVLTIAAVHQSATSDTSHYIATRRARR